MNSGESPAGLSIRGSSVRIAVIAIFVLSEVFSGVLRYSLGEAGLAAIVYLPKILLITTAAFAGLGHPRRFVLAWGFLGISLSAIWANVHGASLANVIFSFFALSPLLAGYLLSEDVRRRQGPFCALMALCLIASIIGVGADYWLELPWAGYTYAIGDVEIVASREWWAMGMSRIAGFSRLSVQLAIMIAAFAFYLHSYIPGGVLRFLLLSVSAVAVALTTSKAPLLGMLLGAIVVLFPRTRKSALWGAFGVGAALPVVAILIDLGAILPVQTHADSLAERFTVAWPGFAAIVVSSGGPVLGAGFGSVGSSVAAFPIRAMTGNLWPNLAVADSTALYLWGMLGFVGVILYFAFGRVVQSLERDRSRDANSAFLVALFLVVVGWTTDVLESAIATFFIGLVIGGATRKSRATPA